MTIKFSIISCLLIALAIAAASFAGETVDSGNQPGTLNMSVDQILDEVEKIYTASGFSANFIQASTIKAMEITDSASGKVSIKYPGKMRWVYQTPEEQIIVSDGVHLWIYRPVDNQVLKGQASTFFGDGKGAGFLSDIRKIRDDFHITLEDIRFGDYYNLKMVPRQKTWDLVRINLLVSKQNFHITHVYTYNAYEDVTRIEFLNLAFDAALDPSLFEFQIPDNVDILELE
ncbi:MAG: outer membrane lipoprotein carrier protein LolA [Deltaproteobacteria bacterium]|nr:outer membrane lipoprotein carrier protein LolA [Deltaproteobacteria bacterium]